MALWPNKGKFPYNFIQRKLYHGKIIPRYPIQPDSEDINYIWHLTEVLNFNKNYVAQKGLNIS